MIINDNPLGWVKFTTSVDLSNGHNVNYVGVPQFTDEALITSHDTGYVQYDLVADLQSIELVFCPNSFGIPCALISVQGFELHVSNVGNLVLNGVASSHLVKYDQRNQLILMGTKLVLNGVEVQDLVLSALPVGIASLGNDGVKHNCKLFDLAVYDYPLTASAYNRALPGIKKAFTDYADLESVKTDYMVMGEFTHNVTTGLTNTSPSDSYIESYWLKPGDTLYLFEYIDQPESDTRKIEFRADETIMLFGEAVTLSLALEPVLQVVFDSAGNTYLFSTPSESVSSAATKGVYLMPFAKLAPSASVTALPITTHKSNPIVVPPEDVFKGQVGFSLIWANFETKEQANQGGYDVVVKHEEGQPSIVYRSVNRQKLNIQQGYISNKTTIQGAPAPDRRVLCYLQSGTLIDETRSNALGVYRFDNLELDKKYMIVAQDKPEYGQAEYNATVADFQTPEAYT
ncbi:hypothetical protein [Pseudoalteromonas luteoviolacea]|uniref:hypothetical protein n=1 Tax=Pseudoalteromonas luteoviolacea TaxID=43657 RepID=UPI001B392F25|nr:hypothetical protein [Pseudoalteromonas luteoviolacea]MBQ4838848.1 hypothetical protein [Pseudoalteromonas luteoviolacea]